MTSNVPQIAIALGFARFEHAHAIVDASTVETTRVVALFAGKQARLRRHVHARHGVAFAFDSA